MEKLRNLIREAVLQVLEEVNQVPGGLVDANGKEIRTGKMVRPVDKNDKRWGRIAGVTIDLKIRVDWMDQESKHSGKTKSAENSKNLEVY